MQGELLGSIVLLVVLPFTASCSEKGIQGGNGGSAALTADEVYHVYCSGYYMGSRLSFQVLNDGDRPIEIRGGTVGDRAGADPSGTVDLDFEETPVVDGGEERTFSCTNVIPPSFEPSCEDDPHGDVLTGCTIEVKVVYGIQGEAGEWTASTEGSMRTEMWSDSCVPFSYAACH